jgi:hypothetical protein
VTALKSTSSRRRSRVARPEYPGRFV